jgi:hypothetical protein
VIEEIDPIRHLELPSLIQAKRFHDAEIPQREARSPERVPSEIAAGRHRQEDPSRSLGLASQRVTRRPEIRDGFLCLYLFRRICLEKSARYSLVSCTGSNHNSNLKMEVCENSCLIGIRRCKMAATGVVMSSQAPEVEITPTRKLGAHS